MQKRISRLQDALQTATEKTVALKISSERKQKKEESLDLLFYIYPERDPAAAQEALNAIILGNMNHVIAQVTKFGASPNPAVVGMNGGYTIYESLTGTTTPGMADKYSHEYGYYENELHYYSDFSDMLGDLGFLEYRRYGAMALYEILAHVKALTEIGSTTDPASNSTNCLDV